MWQDDDQKGDCLLASQTSFFARLFLHSPISSGWEIGWKINERQGGTTSEAQQQDTDVVVAQSRAGRKKCFHLSTLHNHRKFT